MHNRQRVPGESVDEAKKEATRRKVEQYMQLAQHALQKRKDREYSEDTWRETMKLLQLNPEFYTLWNFRREILLEFEKTQTPEQIATLLNSELRFLDEAIAKDQKAYSLWTHRRWVVEKLKSEEVVKRELMLCAKLLKQDERNFHCWEYRGWVAKLANNSPQEEFDFTTTKINSNFSNYSAWHYRSCALPKLSREAGDSTEKYLQRIKEESELAQQAVFTDPRDQSAWLYYRWLLSQGSSQNIRIGGVLYNSTLALTFSVPVIGINKESVEVFVNDSLYPLPSDSDWRRGNASTASSIISPHHIHILDLEIAENSSIVIKLNRGIKTSVQSSIIPAVLTLNDQYFGEISTFLVNDYEIDASSSPSQMDFEKEVEMIDELLKIEPDCKWALLTKVHLLSLIQSQLASVDKKQEISRIVNILSSLDPQRANYYRDLESGFGLVGHIESRISSFRASREQNSSFSLSQLNLSALKRSPLVRILGVKELDLSQNRLRSVQELDILFSINKLNLDDNCISRVFGLEALADLFELSLQNNAIYSFESLLPLSNLSNLQSLDLRGNKICELEEFASKCHKIIPSLKFLNGEAL